MAMSLFLGNLGYAVIEVPTREDLARALARSSAQLVLVDLEIGSEEGFDRCRALAAASTAPLIVMTTLDSNGSVPHAFESGARHVLLKPVSSELLLERLKETLAASMTA
jgi:DNA-binding response OmpR family regulator